MLDVGNYLSVVALDSFHSNPVPGPQTDWLRGVLAKRRNVPFVVTLHPGRAEFSAVDPQGEEFDRFTIEAAKR